MRLFLTALCLTFSGCCVIPPHSIDIDIKGKNLKTPYGEIEDGEIHVHNHWMIKCPEAITNAAK